MGSIKTAKDMSLDLTLSKAKGKITLEDMLNWISDYYSGPVTQLALWDLTEADLSESTPEEVEQLASKAKTISPLRKHGKTAVVFSKDLEFGIGRMFQTLTEIKGAEFEYNIFREVSAAKKWLGV